MKKLLLSVLAVLLTASLFSQSAPGMFKYQAVLRDAAGAIRANASVSIDVVILKGSASGDIVYSENFAVSTNKYGLVSLNIGSVTPADFGKINWAAGPYFIQVLVDGTEMGTSQLLSVPYALYAEKANVPGVQGPQGPQGPAGEGGGGGIGGTDSVVITSPNGKVWALKVDNNGNVTATPSQLPKVVDVDGYSYNQVVIGTQTWLKENLRTTHFNDGTPILVADNAAWAALIADTVTPALGILHDSVYYNWEVANTPGKNPCPAGFHVPSKAEWGVLAAFAGGTLNADATAWEGCASHLKSVAAGGTDDYGFKGELLGARDGGDGHYNLGWSIARWWARGPLLTSDHMATEIGLWNGNDNLSVGAWYWNGGENLRCVKGDLVFDADGNNYTPVKIGNQTWLKENLKTTKFNDGTAILNANDNAVWSALIADTVTAAYGFQNSDKSMGGFYNWQVANTTGKNPCPSGYHVPTTTEFEALLTFAGGTNDGSGTYAGVGNILRAVSQGGTDNFGFSHAGNGIRDGGNGNYQWAPFGVYWLNGPFKTADHMADQAGFDGADVSVGPWYWNSGYNIRCVK